MELLIAATMMSVLFIGLGAHLRGGLIVWQRATSSGEALQQERVAFDRLERDLANAVVYDDRDDAYGEAKGLLPRPQFGDTALSVFTVSVEGHRQPPTVQFVTYACEAVNGSPGLWRTSQSVGAARAKGSEPIRQLVLPDCEALAFHYAYLPSEERRQELEWDATWPDDPTRPLRLPRLIRVSVRASGREARVVCAIPPGIFGRHTASPPPSSNRLRDMIAQMSK